MPNPDLTPSEQKTVDDFHRLYYGRWSGETGPVAVDWRGVRTLKCPLDLWMYQEIIHRRKPDLIVETGSFRGGSALFLADVCVLQGHGRVVSIDVAPVTRVPQLEHERLQFVTASSVDPETVETVCRAARASTGCGREPEVLVILDSLHTTTHVFAEMAAYAPLVRPGGYLIVEDTNINGRPVLPEFGSGPAEAVALFLAKHPQFERDAVCERFLMTLNPGGYLRRKE